MGFFLLGDGLNWSFTHPPVISPPAIDLPSRQYLGEGHWTLLVDGHEVRAVRKEPWRRFFLAPEMAK